MWCSSQLADNDAKGALLRSTYELNTLYTIYVDMLFYQRFIKPC